MLSQSPFFGNKKTIGKKIGLTIEATNILGIKMTPSRKCTIEFYF